MTEPTCQDCKRWDDCPFNLKRQADDGKDKDWYAYGEIRWCPFQVIWILRNADVLDSGRWPAQPTKSEEGKRQIKTEGPQVKPKLIIGEVNLRLETTDMAGKLLRAQAKAGDSFATLEPEARLALMYVKGLNRKVLTFPEWRKKRKYRQKTSQIAQKGYFEK